MTIFQAVLETNRVGTELDGEKGWNKIGCQLKIVDTGDNCVGFMTLLALQLNIFHSEKFGGLLFFLRILYGYSTCLEFLRLFFFFTEWFWWLPGRNKWSLWLLRHPQQPACRPPRQLLLERTGQCGVGNNHYFPCVISPRKRLLFSLHPKGDTLCCPYWEGVIESCQNGNWLSSTAWFVGGFLCCFVLLP